MTVGERINAYRCPDCGKDTVTVDIDEGVTPMMLRCRVTEQCQGVAQSMFYRVPHGIGPPSWEWYRPSRAEQRRASPDMRDHYRRGGLDIRKIGSGRKMGSVVDAR